MHSSLIQIIEEQVLIGFSGKINIVDGESRQILGHIVLEDGDVWGTSFKGKVGLKAFYNLCLLDLESQSMNYIVEPELIKNYSRQIHYPFSVLKKKLSSLASDFKAANRNRPPGNLKVIINSGFIEMGDKINNLEYSLLCTLSDYNKVEDVYKNSELLDFEITSAFVSLREKRALKVVRQD